MKLELWVYCLGALPFIVIGFIDAVKELSSWSGRALFKLWGAYQSYYLKSHNNHLSMAANEL